jgi:acid phosphatase (class A)
MPRYVTRIRTQLLAKCCNRREVSRQGFLAALQLTAFLLVTAAGAPHALAADPKFSFVDSRTIDLSRLLPPPPSDTSEVTRAELDAMLLIQERRSVAEAARALSDNEVGIEAFSEALGSSKSLVDLRLPLLNELARKVEDDSSPMIGAAKQAFGRPRPYALEKRLKPVVPLPGGSSLPSGHATWGYITALMLADMVPERRVQILARADEFGRSRVIAGVHFPSDVESSRVAATIFTAFLFASPRYVKERAAAAKELRGALGLPALLPKS